MTYCLTLCIILYTTYLLPDGALRTNKIIPKTIPFTLGFDHPQRVYMLITTKLKVILLSVGLNTEGYFYLLNVKLRNNKGTQYATTNSQQ